ncbi:TetR/AcrR family transcriptional regulator [Sulfuricurvum sp.]|uniref:TetR/AcrR family transcriptional regulator n=1 Tax=Sulfuricurvum sp. TaxID=2025608 RepID=UPI00260F4F49|nr:TetR/AcrR family transcriptional regulator [Sulfuricurvum sp.]MDD3597342.1 TetR/AcrR family transcriptional regulator [Sulfuricurvum sp.]
MKENMRDILVQTMFESLYQEGYNASNLIDLLKKAGTSKGGMYHYFGSKKELALESMRIVGEGFIDHFWDGCFARHDDPIRALEEILKALPNAMIIGECPFDFKHGCPLNHMIQEMSALDEDFKILLESIMDRWITLIAENLKMGQNIGVLGKSFEPTRMAQFIVSSVEGTLTLMKVKQDIRIYEENMELLLQTLKVLTQKG